MTEAIGSSVYLIIQGFIEKLTEDQWKSLTSDSPSNVTNILVAEMTLNIIDAVTESMMSDLSSVRLEDAVPGLEELLQQSFCEALHIKEADESLKSLTKMIRQENQENLNALRAPPEPSDVNQHITSPSRLNRMVCCINDLLSKVGAKVTAVFQPSKDREKGGEEEQEKTQEQEEEEEQVVPEEEEKTQKQEEEHVVAEEETVDRWITPDSVQEKIKKELRDISTQLTEEVSGEDLKQLEFVSSEEMEKVGKEVALLVSKEAEGKRSFKGLRNQLKLVFAECFLRVWLCRLLAQLKKKHREDIRVESCQAMVEQLTPQLLSDLHGQDESSSSLKVKSKHITGAKVLVLTQRLTPLLSPPSSASTPSDPDVEGPAGDKQLLPHAKTEIYKDVRRQSWICTVLMKWFLKTVVKGVGAGLKLSILQTQPAAAPAEPPLADPEEAEPTAAAEPSEPTDAPVEAEEVEPAATPVRREEPPAEGAAAAAERWDEGRQGVDSEADIKASYVKTFIEKVVFHVCVDAHVLFGNKYKVSEAVFEKVWAEVKNHSMYVTPRSFKNLDKKIHQRLCGRFQPLELLCLMTLQDPEVTDLCTSLVKQRLMTPPQQPLVKRFFSSMAKVLCRSFRKDPGSA